MNVVWSKVKSYEETKLRKNCVYIHVWNKSLYYIGKAENSTFSGEANSRYNVAYRHWIDGCLDHGAELYFGSPEAAIDVSTLEETLILAFLPKKNTDISFGILNFGIFSSGAVPEEISTLNSQFLANKCVSNYLRKNFEKITEQDKNSQLDLERYKILMDQRENRGGTFGVEKIIDIFERVYSDVEKIGNYKLKKVLVDLCEIYRAFKKVARDN
jgi:hypothetical protein